MAYDKYDPRFAQTTMSDEEIKRFTDSLDSHYNTSRPKPVSRQDVERNRYKEMAKTRGDQLKNANEHRNTGKNDEEPPKKKGLSKIIKIVGVIIAVLILGLIAIGIMFQSNDKPAEVEPPTEEVIDETPVEEEPADESPADSDVPVEDVPEDDVPTEDPEDVLEEEPADEPNTADEDIVDEGTGIPDKYVLATDEDFEFVSTVVAINSYDGDKGYYAYIGTDPYVIIPETINGNTLIDYFRMFYNSSSIRGVATENSESVSIMQAVFSGIQTPSLELTYFDTSNTVSMESMFGDASVPKLDMSVLNTSSTMNMNDLFISSSTSTVDMRNLDLSALSKYKGMFRNSNIKKVIVSSGEHAEMLRDDYAHGSDIEFEIVE